MNQKLLIGSLSLAVAFASISADAARNYTHSGVGCIQAEGSQNSLDRGQYGVDNTSTTASVTVECPVNISFNASANPVVTIAGIQAYDRNSSTNVNCNLQKIDGNGNIIYTTNFQTSGSGSAAMPQTNASVNETVIGTWRMRCSIPARVGSDRSHVVSYTLVTNE